MQILVKSFIKKGFLLGFWKNVLDSPISVYEIMASTRQVRSEEKLIANPGMLSTAALNNCSSNVQAWWSNKEAVAGQKNDIKNATNVL